MSDVQLSSAMSDSLSLSPKRAATPSLPSELLYQIFTHCDPATVLLSLRCLSSSWRHKVDRSLLPHLFSTRAWRVGVQISRRPRHGHSWGGSIVGTPGATTPNGLSIEEEDEEMRRQRWQDERERISLRTGALEDELPGFPLPHATTGKPAPVTHVIPLEFGRISHTPLTQQSTEPTLRFATRNSNWYALFESNDDEDTLPADPEQARIERRRRKEEARLALDFGLIWRFPGDGQGDAEWGTPDPEMGWLSRFYCSQGDLVKDPAESAAAMLLNVKGKQTVRSTPLARRVRSRLGADFDDNGGGSGSHTPPSLDWSDAGQEYLNLNLALSVSFFARRSARSNKLMRLLEEAAERSDSEPSGSGSTLRVPWTPLERGKKKKGKPTASPAPSCASPAPFRPGAQSGALWMASGASLGSNKQISRLTAGQSGAASGANTPFRSGAMTPISRPATPSTSSRTRALATPAPVAPRATFQATLLSAEALAPLRRQQAEEDENGASSSSSASASAYMPAPAAVRTAPSAWDDEPRNEWGVGTSRSAQLDEAQAGDKAQVWTWTR